MSFLTDLLHLAHPTRKMRQDFQNKRRKMFDLDLDLHRGFMVVIVFVCFLYVFETSQGVIQFIFLSVLAFKGKLIF